MDDDISENSKNELDKELVYLNNKIISYVNGILNGYKKDVKKVYDTLIEKEEIDGDELREIFRTAFEKFQTPPNQVYIDNHFITISSNMTNYSIDRFKDDIRLINKILNTFN